MGEKKQILQGIDNFKRLITNNGYYVDKTFFAKKLIDKPDQIVLITRPRRFGKTLNMSMLKYFFEIPQCRRFELEEEDVSYLFQGLKIFEDEKYRVIQGTYPVVYLTFKDAKQNNWEDTYENLKSIISSEYKRHRYLLDGDCLSEIEKEKYTNILNLKASKIDYTDVIKNLTDYLRRYYKKECMVFIDEYDTPIQAGYINGYFNEVIEFQKSILVKGFKDNLALKQGVLTGIMKVAQESIFSDFNNPKVATHLSEEYKDCFGFTEEEVEKMAGYFGFEKMMPDIKEWYNGYIFGLDTVIYNPWSIIKFMSNPKEGLKPYWVNTSDNRVIKDVLQLDKKEGKEVVKKLIKGEEVRKPIQENVIYQTIKDNPEAAWSFLLHAGYLKASQRIKDSEGEKFEYNLEIPNKEVRSIYKDMILNFFEEDAKVSKDIEYLLYSLLKKDIDKFERLLKELYEKQVSYHDIAIKSEPLENISEGDQDYRYENFHHGFILGLMMYAIKEYFVLSNKEYGLGRPDIVIIPRNSGTAYVFEFKWDSTKGNKNLDYLAQTAIEQIQKKKYVDGIKALHNVDEVIAIGVGFKGKELKVNHF